MRNASLISARPTRWAVFLLVPALLASACRKPEKDLGLDLLPGDPLGILVDTATLHAFTFQPEAIRTSGLTRNLLGSYLDPQFGHVNAGLVAQLRLSVNNVGAGQDNSGLVADSLVLALGFDAPVHVYGNLESQIFQVFEILDTLTVDSVYQTDKVPEFLPQDLAAERGGRLQPQPNKPVVIGGDSLQPQLRIRLNDALADRFIQAFGTPDLASNDAFLQFFRGVYVKVDNGNQLPFQQGVLYFNLIGPTSKATLYFRDLLSDAPDSTLTLDLPINQNSVRYTVASFDHAQALDQALPMALADTTAEAALTWVQALGGLRTAIRFPHLMEMAQPGRVLAKAELVVPVSGTFNPYLLPPTQLFIFRKDTAGTDLFLPDQVGGSEPIGGLYSTADREYRFNITRYIQQVLTGELPNDGVELVPASNGISANRAVLAGPANPVKPLRLRLTFTTY
ncbi:MAG: DUF4270 domain-containing protein [Flavobacteriales bacterium]|nr:DUF4270 domain-containing protein [Flavobacteriales bacterium]